MSKIDISIVIVNWNSADYVMECLRSIYEHTSAVSCEVIVVDNASFDGCGDLLAHRYQEVIFIQSESNLGFARANNLGAENAGGDVLLFLNPDTEVRDRAIERLYVQLQSLNNPGVVGCRLLNSDESLQTSCVQSLPTLLNQMLDADVLRRLFPRSSLWGIEALYESGTTPAEVEAVSGACMMMRRSVFDAVGGFSSDYFMYAEDLDLCSRLRRAGFHNYYFPGAIIVHHGGGSSQQTRSNFSNVMMRESVRRFLSKSSGSLYSECYRFALNGVATIRLALLMLLFPVSKLKGRKDVWLSAFGKWWSILRWSYGLERLTGPGQPGSSSTRTAGKDII